MIKAEGVDGLNAAHWCMRCPSLIINSPNGSEWRQAMPKTLIAEMTQDERNRFGLN